MFRTSFRYGEDLLELAYKNYQALGIAQFSHKDWPLQNPDILQFLKLTRRSFPCRYQISGCGG